MKISIYLAGSIQKGHEKTDTCWEEAHMQYLREQLPHFEIAFLNPAFRADDLSMQLSVFGRDMLQVFCADFVFVDARDRRGLGVGAEMMWAKFNHIPVITWAPKNSHYHKNNTSVLGVPVAEFVHPFVESLSDKLAEDLAEGAHFIKEMMEKPQKVKGPEFIYGAMKYYQAHQLEKDTPMQAMLPLLKKKLAEIA